MMKKEYYKACDLFIEPHQRRIKEEYLNEYGYNIYANRKKSCDHFKEFSYTNQNNVKIKPKQ